MAEKKYTENLGLSQQNDDDFVDGPEIFRSFKVLDDTIGDLNNLETKETDKKNLVNAVNESPIVIMEDEISTLLREQRFLYFKVTGKKRLDTPKYIIMQEDIPINEREKDAYYLKVTDKQSNIKVSPNMGLKVL